MACFSANFAFVTETNVVSVQQAQNVVAAQQRAAGWILYLRWFRNGCLSLGFVRRKCDEKDNFWFGLLPNSARQAGSCTFAGFVRQGSPTPVEASYGWIVAAQQRAAGWILACGYRTESFPCKS